MKQFILRIFRNTANGFRKLGKGLMSYGLVAIGGNLSGITDNDVGTITLLLAGGIFFWTIGDMAAEERRYGNRGGDPPRGN